MSLQQVLDQVPFIRHLGVQVEDYSPGRVVLSLATEPTAANHVGTMHAGALFALAEVAASAACATHEDLLGLRLRARGAEVRYRQSAGGQVTAHAEITDEMAASVLEGLAAGGKAELVVPVEILDGRGATVARVTGRYGFRGPE
jgi:thioesterase domain-containing protein